MVSSTAKGLSAPKAEVQSEFPLSEEWKDIPKYEGQYQVSKNGAIKALSRRVNSRYGTRLKAEKILSPCISRKGYARVVLYRDGSQSGKSVARLVAEAFLENYSNELTVDHINGDKLDNRVQNLRAVSRGQNCRGYNSPRLGTSSKYRGVHWREISKRWIALIGFKGEYIYVGTFTDEKKAAKAWNRKALEIGFSPEALNQF